MNDAIPEQAVAAPSGEVSSKAQTAGRGGIAVLAAKGFFIVTGFAQQVLLRHAIGGAEYGALSRAQALSNIVNNVVVSGSTQSVSRTVAAAGTNAPFALRGALRVHVPLAIALAVLFAALAPAYTAFEAAPQILPTVLLLSGVVLLYGLYAPLVGAINGQNRFTQQAALDILFATFRTVLMVGLGYLFVRRNFGGALGSAAGFVLAALLIVGLALRWTGTGKSQASAPPEAKPVDPKAYLAFLLPIAGAQLFTNLLMQADLSLLGRFLSLGAPHGADGARLADDWVGIYRNCQLFAFLPYQLLFSVTQVLFPMLARAKAEGDKGAVRAYALRGSRIGAVVAGLLVALVVSLAGPLLALAFGAEAAARGEVPLRILAMGQGAFAILGVALTVLTSLGRERTSFMLTAAATFLVAALCWLFVPSAEFGASQLTATALSTSGALALVLVVAVVVVAKEAGAFVGLLTSGRVLAAFAAASAVGAAVPHAGVHGVVGLLALVAGVSILIVVVYVGVLVVTRELSSDDVAAVRAVVNRRQRK